MKKKEIVKKQIDFTNIIKKGNSYKSKYLVIYYKDNKLKMNRYGISVGKKLGNAVFRNKYKRKLRAIIDNNKNDYILNKDYIIILREKGKEKNFHDLENDYIYIMDKIRKEIKNEKI